MAVERGGRAARWAAVAMVGATAGAVVSVVGTAVAARATGPGVVRGEAEKARG